MPCPPDTPRANVSCASTGNGSVRRFDTLEDTATDFRDRLERDDDAETAYFRKVHSFARRLEDAALSRYVKEGDGYKRCGHQHRLKPRALVAGLEGLRLIERRLETSHAFEDLHRRIVSVALHTHGLGALWAYDTAARIGAVLDLFPGAVFLHAGALKGAEELGFDVRGRRKLPLHEVRARYPELRRFSADELESFFCIYKRHFGRFRRPAPRLL